MLSGKQCAEFKTEMFLGTRKVSGFFLLSHCIVCKAFCWFCDNPVQSYHPATCLAFCTAALNAEHRFSGWHSSLALVTPTPLPCCKMLPSGVPQTCQGLADGVTSPSHCSKPHASLLTQHKLPLTYCCWHSMFCSGSCQMPECCLRMERQRSTAKGNKYATNIYLQCLLIGERGSLLKCEKPEKLIIFFWNIWAF